MANGCGPTSRSDAAATNVTQQHGTILTVERPKKVGPKARGSRPGRVLTGRGKEGYTRSRTPAMVRPNINITVFFFREGEQIVAYSPALDLSSCGRNLTQAKEMFQKALDAFFESLEEMGTTEKALTELGWRRISSPQRPWRVPRAKTYVPMHLLKTREMRVPLPA